MQAYNIHYGYSKTGWQVASTTVHMLKALNALAKARKRTFRVVLDSAVPHVKAAMILDSQGDQRTFFVFDQLQLYFVPPNLKPPRHHVCHLGVIQAFKARFRYEMLDTLFANYRQWLLHGPSTTAAGDHQYPNGFVPSRLVHARNVFHWLQVALRSLDKALIQSCWIASGLLPTPTVATLSLPLLLNRNSTTTPQQPPQHHVLAAYKDLQDLMDDIAMLTPDFLHWLGLATGPHAQALVEIEGNAAVTDPGIDEVQIIRSVLLKHGYLAQKRLDAAASGGGNGSAGAAGGPGGGGADGFGDQGVQDEAAPPPDQVRASIEILKRYLRLATSRRGPGADLIVQLNQLKSAATGPMRGNHHHGASGGHTI